MVCTAYACCSDQSAAFTAVADVSADVATTAADDDAAAVDVDSPESGSPCDFLLVYSVYMLSVQFVLSV